MLPTRHTFLLVVLAALVCPALASAQLPSGVPPIEVHGFVSPGYIVSGNNNYLAYSKLKPGDGSLGSFEFTEVALNVTSQITENLRVGFQLFMRDLGPIGNYNAKFDWFYLDYHFADWFGVRAGRTKLPFGLYNEVNDIDSARLPVLLPQSVYPVQNRDFLLAQTGAEVYGYIRLGNAGAIDYRLYGGTIYLVLADQQVTTFSVSRLGVPYLFGGRVMYETPIDGLRLGGSLQTLRLDIDGNVPTPAGNLPLNAQLPAVLWVGSAEYTMGDWLFAGEYSRWHIKINGAESSGLPVPKGWQESERFYLMASYRVLPWFQPGAYYSVYFPNVDKRTDRENQQQDWAATLRFDINDHWLVKLEGHYMWGTAGLSSELNDNKPLSDLTRTWGVFMLKTTAYF